MEFEKFVCDIVQVREGIMVETFKEGKDGGIDGLFVDKGDKTTVIQVKRYGANYSGLYRDLTKEYVKVKKINPKRYILGVSLDLSLLEKNKIIDLFDGYIKTTTDILSSVDLNRLLEEDHYKHIEIRYHKLWVSSINVFQKMLNTSIHHSIHMESNLEMKKALEISDVFVSTKKYREVSAKSLNKNVVIISGEPGVGKTSMAYLLALAYMYKDDLDNFLWVNSINDIYKTLKNDEKQVFIFDDFWGSILHNQSTVRNSEAQLNKIIHEIQSFRGEKFLILTSREYILQQGLQRYPLLKDTIEKLAVMCTIDDYSYEEKANILYSHLYVSNLEYDYVKYIYYNSRSIVFNKNYNPRVIDLFIEREYVNDISPEDFYLELLNYLDHPFAFWEEIFKSLSRESKIVVLLMLISSSPMRYADLHKCYDLYVQNSTDKTKVSLLEDCVAELEKTMIKSFYDFESEEVLLQFTNPAVQDFLFYFLKKYANHYVGEILNSCCYYNQLLFLLEYISMHCNKSVEQLIIQHCIDYYDTYPISYIYDNFDWNWDQLDKLSDFENGTLNRLFHIIRCSDEKKQPHLMTFIEEKIKKYCMSMGEEDWIPDQYIDLWELPSLIQRCANKGIQFNSQEVLTRYYKSAFSIHHYIAMKSFSKIFPNEYKQFDSFYSQIIKRKIKGIILNEIDLLDEFEMDVELDLLVDNVPEYLQDFGLTYTKKFEEKIYNLCGRTPINQYEINQDYSSHKSDEDFIDQEERGFYEVHNKARGWILGPTPFDVEEELMHDIVSASNIRDKLKTEINNVIESGQPGFIYNVLEKKETIHLFLDMLENSGDFLPKNETELSLNMIMYICGDNKELISSLVHFCGNTFISFMHQDEPIIRKENFINSEVYQLHLKNNKLLKEIIFNHFILEDGRWIRFTGEYIFIFSFVILCIYESMDDNEIQESFQTMLGENFSKLKIKSKTEYGDETEVAFAEFGPYYLTRYDWEGIICRMFYEIIPHDFVKFYVELQ